jgi:hypothetical protein
MMRIWSRFLTLAAVVIVISAAAPIDPAHAVRCLKRLTRNGTVTYCGGGYVDLNGRVYTKKKAMLAPSHGPKQGPVQISHPVTINATSHQEGGGGRH